MSEVEDKWVENLKEFGYEHHCHSIWTFLQLKYLPGRIVRRLIKLGHVSQSARIVEFGCGGGIKLAPLALMGCDTVGVDISPDVLARADHFKADLEQYTGSELKMRFVEADILEPNLQNLADHSFNLVFSVGVIEHFLKQRERILVLENKFRLAKGGGWVVNIVPSGIHPKRYYMKATESGGYNIPEIDYTPNMLINEMKEAGFINISVLGHNLFGYLALADTPVERSIGKIINIVARITLPAVLPEPAKQKYSSTLIAVGQKPREN